MKNMILKSLVILSLFASVGAFAAGAPAFKAADVATSDDMTDKLTKDMKDGQDALKDATYKQNVHDNATADLSKISGGTLDTQMFNAALSANLTLTINGKSVTLNMLGIAQSIRDAKNSIDTMNTQGLDEAGKADLSAKQALVKLAPQFIALAANMDAAAVDSRYVTAFANEVATIQILLAKGNAADINSHMELMQGALQHQAQNPSMTGNAAFKAALTDKFGAKADQKADDLNGCQRDVLF